MAKYTGTGVIASTDYKKVKFVGKTKSGHPITIELKDAINMNNIDLSFADKNDTVAQVVFTATYSNTDAASTSTEEPWTLEVPSEVKAGAGEILLGVGIFYIGETPVAMTRGGGQFVVTRGFRQIGADGDRGPVKDRIVIDESVATLTMNILTAMTMVGNMYPAISTVTE